MYIHTQLYSAYTPCGTPMTHACLYACLCTHMMHVCACACTYTLSHLHLRGIFYPSQGSPGGCSKRCQASGDFSGHRLTRHPHGLWEAKPLISHEPKSGKEWPWETGRSKAARWVWKDFSELLRLRVVYYCPNAWSSDESWYMGQIKAGHESPELF